LGIGGSFQVDPSSGNSSVFFNSGTNMNHTAGVQHDTRGGRNRLLLCSVGALPPPFGPGGTAGGVINLDLTGASPSLAAFYDTSAFGTGSVRFCNDIIADDAGNIYATDSFGSQVWKITPGGVVSTFIHDSRWDEPTNFALDGIELTPNGNLIVSHISHSELWLVTTAAPVTATQIVVTGNSVAMNPDGIYFGPHGCLYTVGNGHVFRLVSSNNWLNATVLETVTVNCPTPTAITYESDASAYYVSCANNFGAGPYYLERINFVTAETDALCNPSSTTSGAATSVASALMVAVLVVLALLF